MKILSAPTCAAAVILTGLLLAGCDSRKPESAPPPPTSNLSFSSAAPADPHSGPGIEIPMGSAKAVTPLFANLEVEKAAGENSYQVGELFALGAELDGQTVRVRAQVVKFSPAIMGRNFIHLQDGSGNPDESTHNLVATSDETVQPGDIVTFEGVLAANRDFGAGYLYQVILEESRVTQ